MDQQLLDELTQLARLSMLNEGTTLIDFLNVIFPEFAYGSEYPFQIKSSPESVAHHSRDRTCEGIESKNKLDDVIDNSELSFDQLRVRNNTISRRPQIVLKSTGQVDKKYQNLSRVLHSCSKIVFLIGAGVSTSVGIPDFRSKEGLYNQDFGTSRQRLWGKELFDQRVLEEGSISLEEYRTRDLANKNQGPTFEFYKMVQGLCETSVRAIPSDFHRLIAHCAEQGRVLRLLSQNIDCLETQFGVLQTECPIPDKKADWPVTIQMHGSISHVECRGCSKISATYPTRLLDRWQTMICEICASRSERSEGKLRDRVQPLKPRIGLYHGPIPQGVLISSIIDHSIREADALIVAGTSARIDDIQKIVKDAHRHFPERGYEDNIIWISRECPLGGMGKYFSEQYTDEDCDDVAMAVSERNDAESDSST